MCSPGISSYDADYPVLTGRLTDTAGGLYQLNDLVESVSKRLETLSIWRTLEAVSQENQFDFTEICRIWQRLARCPENGFPGVRTQGRFCGKHLQIFKQRKTDRV
jgi:hypothetical protein